MRGIADRLASGEVVGPWAFNHAHRLTRGAQRGLEIITLSCVFRSLVAANRQQQRWKVGACSRFQAPRPLKRAKFPRGLLVQTE